MAKGSMKNIWGDRKREDERLQKLATRKKPADATNVTEAVPENSAEQKSEDKQGK